MKPNGFPGNEIMQSFSDKAKCAERFVARVCFFLCAQEEQHRDAKMLLAILLFSWEKKKKKDLSQCSAYLYVSRNACDLFIYFIFNYSLRLSMKLYAVLWFPGV